MGACPQVTRRLKENALLLTVLLFSSRRQVTVGLDHHDHSRLGVRSSPVFSDSHRCVPMVEPAIKVSMGILKIGKALGVGTGTVQRVLIEQPRPFGAAASA